MKFLVKLVQLSGDNIRKSVRKSDIFDSITTAYNKDIVMPLVVEPLMEEGVIVTGDNDQEVRISKKRKMERRTMPLLQILNDAIIFSEESFIDITVNMNGLIISGTLVSIKEYYQALNQQFNKQTRGTDLEIAFNMLIEALPKTEEEKEVTTRLFGTRHFCLKNPKFYPGGRLMNGEGTYWMGKLDSVDGFFIGIWSQE